MKLDRSTKLQWLFLFDVKLEMDFPISCSNLQN
jgi:hypothetical protein